VKLGNINIQKPVLILTHSIADPDAVCSALSLKYTFNADAMIPDILTSPSKSILSFLNIRKPFKKLNIHDYKTIIITDANSYSMLGRCADAIKTFKGRIVIVDHHSTRKDTIKTPYMILDEKAQSTCELLFDLLPINKKTAALLLFGILFDSAEFKNMNTKTFAIISKLLEKSGYRWEDIQHIIKETRDFSTRLIKLKAVKTCSAYRISQILITTAIVSNFEGMVADAFIDLGADISFVAAQSKSETRISARMHPLIPYLKLSEIMRNVAEKNRGTGGGHRCAAGANLPKLIKNNVKNVLDDCVQETIKLLKSKKLAKGRVKCMF